MSHAASSQPISAQGQLLLAMPGIGDPRFERACILICAHDHGGAMGIGIDRLIPRISLHKLLQQLDIALDQAPDVPVHWGGPVEPQRGFVIHSHDWRGQDTHDIADEWALTGTLDILRAIAAGEGPQRWLVALGYAGWSAGQLDEELTRHGWLLGRPDDQILFKTEADARWSASFRAVGIDPALLVAAPGRA
jgi:putative transcriptional regulator